MQLVQFSFQTLQIKKLCFPKYHMLNVHISFLEGSLNTGNSATGTCTSTHRLPTAHCRASQQFKLVCSSRIYHLSEEWLFIAEERPHALRPLNPSFSQIVDRWSWSSITIVNSRSLPQIVIFNDHGSFKPINDHDRKLKKRRSRIVVVANDRRSSDRLRQRNAHAIFDRKLYMCHQSYLFVTSIMKKFIVDRYH